MNRGVALIVFLVSISVIASSLPMAEAVTFEINDQDSKVFISLDSTLGSFHWEVDEIDHLFQQWFWFRIGDSDPELSLNRLDRGMTTVEGNTLSTTFTGDDGLVVNVSWELESISVKAANLHEIIEIKNTGTSVIDMHFFQYTDFDVRGPSNDEIVIVPPNMALQSDTTLTETVVSPDPDHFEVGPFDETRAKLQDDFPTTLSDFAGPITADGAWAFQWDVEIEPGESFFIIKKKSIFEPLVSSGSSTWEPPTIGPDRKGILKVENGICINISCWTVNQDYHIDFELFELLTGTNTISLEIFCPRGVANCNYAAIGVTPPGDNVNSAIWQIGISKNSQGEWQLKVTDPEFRLGEITFTTQIIDNFRIGVSITFEHKNLSSDKQWLWVQVRDSNNGVRNFYFNEGIKFKDVDAYPYIQTSYESPIHVEPLCFDENPSKRTSCAFEKVRDWATKNAQASLDEIMNSNTLYRNYQ